jgi:hypothetical protein
MTKQSSGRLAWLVVLGIGFAIGCKGSKHPDGWHDACCAQCNEGHCLECTDSSADCEEKGMKAAECIQQDAGLMCREKGG